MPFSDDLSTYPLDHCFPDGATFGSWKTIFAGFGCVSVAEVNGKRRIRLKPKAANAPDVTHAALVVGPAFHDSLQFECGMVTTHQLRQGSAPNAWEVGWLVWHYSDNAHFYYFTLKPNGWELGKCDPAYPGGQRFLVTGPLPATPVMHRHEVLVEQAGAQIRISVDGGLISEFTDFERPYVKGKIGFYCEDSDVLFDSIRAG
jgi:hypothetical protein